MRDQSFVAFVETKISMWILIRQSTPKKGVNSRFNDKICGYSDTSRTYKRQMTMSESQQTYASDYIHLQMIRINYTNLGFN